MTFTLEATDSYSDIYGNMDGVTYCGPRTFEISGQPDWVTLSGDMLTLTSSDVFDLADSLSVTLTITLEDGASKEVTITVERTCPDGSTCNSKSTPYDPEEADVPDVTPTELACFSGVSNANEVDEG